MRKMRKLHLWIGLITSAFLFMESATGLIILNPWMIGAKEQERKPMAQQTQVQAENQATSGNDASGQQQAGSNGGGATSMEEGAGEESGSSSFFTLMKRIHTGHLNSPILTVMLNLAAIGGVLLTATGIYLTVKIMQADRRRKRKLAASAA